jgi:transcriptional regulator with XRE-family HTH domain
MSTLIPEWHRPRKHENTVLALDGRPGGEYQSGMNGNALKRMRVAAGLSQAQLAEKAGTSQPQIRRLEAGERKFTKQWAERLAPFVNCSAERLLFPPSGVPIIGYVGAGAAAFFYDDASHSDDFAPRPPDSSAETVALAVKGDSMPGVAEDNWLVYYDQRQEGVTEEMIGELCVVGLEDGRTLVKRIYSGAQPGTFDLISTGHKPIRGVLIAWAAKVDWIKPR